jgi:signal transduction histidine kinase
VDVRVAREGDALRLTVRDDGLGAAAKARGNESGGVGLSNTRARLQHLYGDAHEMRAGPVDAGGFLVSIDIPFHTSAVPLTVAEVTR